MATMATASETQFEVERIPFHLVWREKSPFKETYGGAADVIAVEGQHLKPRGASAKAVLVFMHGDHDRTTIGVARRLRRDLDGSRSQRWQWGDGVVRRHRDDARSVGPAVVDDDARSVESLAAVLVVDLG